MRSKSWACGFVLAGVSAALIASAPIEAQSAESATGAKPETGVLEDIVVTAQRREERLQEVPMAISAFTFADVRAASISNTQDLQLKVPGLIYGSENAFAQPYIRGVGTSIAGSGLETSIATYVDDVYLQQQTGAISQLVDLERVEVLKGPQGTLYGRNATGGAIVVRTQDPTDKLEARVKLGYGRFGDVRAEGILNLPLSETFSARFAVQDNDRTEGYLTNVFTGTKLGQDAHLTGRAKLAWRPKEGTEVIASLEVSRDRDRATNQAQGQLSVCTTCNAFGFGIPPGFYDVSLNTVHHVKNDYTLAAVRASTEVGAFKLFSVTSYRKYFFGGSFDQDITQVNFLNYNTGNNSKTFQQELRASSQFDGALNFTVGAFYEHDRTDAPAYLDGTLFGGLKPGSTQDLSVLTAAAAFGEIYYSFADNFKFTVGGRFNHDKRELAITLNPDGAAVFGTPGFNEGKSFSDFTPRAVLAYNKGDINLYASYGKGFKSGGFNALVFTRPDPVNSEKLKGIEVGGKFTLLDHRVRLDTSVFRYKYDDMQVTFFDPVTSATILRNAASSTLYGADVDVSWAAGRDLTLSAGAAYLHAAFDSFPAGSVYAQGNGSYALTAADLSGATLPYAPKVSGYLSATYTHELTADLESSLSAIASYSDEYDFIPRAGGPLGLDRQDSLTRVNLTGSLGPADHRWTVAFYVENLTDQRYYNARIPVGFGDQVAVALPRTYGGSIEFRF